MRVSRIEPSRHIKGRWLVYLEDDRLLKVTENEMVSFGLCPDVELSEEQIARLLEEGNRSSVRAHAASIIGRRAMSRRELIGKLTERGELPVDAEAAADWLEELGVLSDARYAASLVRHYSSRGYGENRIRQELFRRGISKDHWEAAMEEAELPENGIARFLQTKLKDPNDPKQLKRVTDALLRRGYRWDEIRSGIRAFGAELEEE